MLRRTSGRYGNFEPDEETDKLASEVIDAAFEVHSILGPGLLESAYEEAMARELEIREIEFSKQVPVSVNYKGFEVGNYRLDILVGNRLILELKTVDTLADIHKAQMLHYLTATGLKLGLLINFKTARMKDGIKRIVKSGRRRTGNQ